MVGLSESQHGVAQPHFAELNMSYEYDMPGANRTVSAAAVYATFEQVCDKNLAEVASILNEEQHREEDRDWQEVPACACDEDEEGVSAGGQSPCPASSSTHHPEGTHDSQEQGSAKKRARSCQDRLNSLSKPRQAPELPELPPSMPEKRPEKKPASTRPSLLLRVKPINVDEAMEAFFASECTIAPTFQYSHSDEYVTKHFQANNAVDFELLPQANRILQKVQDEYGGGEAFNHRLYGDDKLSVDELRAAVAQYLKDLNIDDKVEIHVRDGMLSAANVCKPGPDEKYVVNISNQPISRNMVQGICDHEVGTHLLRMMNDEHQVWHSCRDRYKLINPWTTEEGFATLNTYLSMTCKLLYPQALRYWAVCKGAQTGFSELFQELETHVPDKVKRFRMCCRIKRGMIDTSLPGAFYIDQAYFKGAVDLLRHLDEIDFGRLYCGQIALEDLDKVHFVTRKEVVRLPKFLNSYEKWKSYKAHCRALIKENEIVLSEERVCKQVFVRNAKEFFKKPKKEMKMCTAVPCIAPPDPSRTIDLSYLESLAKPREPRALSVPADGGNVENSVLSGKTLDLDRILELAMPRKKSEEEPVPVLPVAPPPVKRRSRPRRDACRTEEQASDADAAEKEDAQGADESASAQADALEETLRRSVNMGRIRDLSRPRSARKDVEEVPLSQVSVRPVDVARLAVLASPRVEVAPPEPEPTKKPKKKRKSKCRILALAQDQRAQGTVDQDSASEGEEEEPQDRQPSSQQASSLSTNSPRSLCGTRATGLRQAESSCVVEASLHRFSLQTSSSGPAESNSFVEAALHRPPLPMPTTAVKLQTASFGAHQFREKDAGANPRSQSVGAAAEGQGTRRLRAAVAATRVSQRMAAAEEASRQRGSFACRQAAAGPPGENFKVVPVQTLQLCI